MTAKTVTCTVIACDICGDELDAERDEGIRHYDSITEAINSEKDEDFEYAWIIQPDGYAVCPTDDENGVHEAARAALRPPPPAEQIPGQQQIPATATDA